MSLTILCPTKGRPVAVAETYETFLATKRLDDTEILFIVNRDEDLTDYPNVPLCIVPTREWMNEVLQEGVDYLLERTDPTYIGFIGDDNRFRTDGWDYAITRSLNEKGGGFAYGNDLMQKDNNCSHVFISTTIVKALGYFGLPGLRHLYIDNAWKTLGLRSHRLYYMPNVIVEHMHPLYGKGETDASYQLSNSPEMYEHDRTVYEAWLVSQASIDAEVVAHA